MVLPCMYLASNRTGCRMIPPHHDEKVLAVKAHPFALVDDFNVTQVLFVRANLILALDDQNTILPEDTVGLLARFGVHAEDCVVPLRAALGRFTIRVVLSKGTVAASPSHVVLLPTVES